MHRENFFLCPIMLEPEAADEIRKNENEGGFDSVHNELVELCVAGCGDSHNITGFKTA